MKVDTVKIIAEYAAAIVELFGIGIIIFIGLYTTFLATYNFFIKKDHDGIFENFRHGFGRGILLGLEFLLAADIIHTVAVDLSFSSLGILGLIVIIRTFLSFALEVEITGKWPWQQRKNIH